MASVATLVVLIIVLVLAKAFTFARSAPPMSPLGYYSRLLLSFVCLIVCALYGVFASIALRLVGKGGLSQWTVARAFKWTMRYAVGVRFDIIGAENLETRPAVFVGNHQT